MSKLLPVRSLFRCAELPKKEATNTHADRQLLKKEAVDQGICLKNKQTTFDEIVVNTADLWHRWLE